MADQHPTVEEAREALWEAIEKYVGLASGRNKAAVLEAQAALEQAVREKALAIPDDSEFAGATPGPWAVVEHEGNVWIQKQGRTGWGIAEVETDEPHPDDDRHANARLIAAAPALLARVRDGEADVSVARRLFGAVIEQMERGVPLDKCWAWQGARDRYGYGEVKRGGRPNQETRRVHREVMRLFGPPMPDGAHVLHKCSNPPCFNPTHLYWGDAKQNADDREAVTTYDRSRANNPNAKLTEHDVANIRHELERGVTHRAIAKRFGVNASTIGRIKSGKYWAGVGDA